MSRKMTVIIALLVSGWYAFMLASVEIPWMTEQHAGTQTQSMKLIQIAEQETEGGTEQPQAEDESRDEETPEDEPTEEIPEEPHPETEPDASAETPVSDEPKTNEQTEAEDKKLSPAAHKPPAEAAPAEAAQQEAPQETEMEYHDVDDVTSAPQFPVDQLLQQLVYPPLARRQGREGVVLLELFISAHGVVERVEVLEDPGYGMGKAARKAFKGITASPAEIRGEQTAVRMRYPVRFTLNN